MSNCMFCAPIRSDAGTLSGGSWEATLPLTNLQTAWLAEVARSTDAALASTALVCDQGSSKRIRAVSLHGHNLSLAAKYRVRAYDTLAVTRADTATYVDEDGVVTSVANNILRQWHYLTDNTSTFHRVTLLERAYTNLVTSDNFDSGWTSSGTPVVTTGVSDPAGGTAAYTIADDDGAASEYKYFAPTFTADAVKAVVFIVKKGTFATSGSQSLILYDNTAGTARLQLDITAWASGSAPTITATTGTHLGTRLIGNGFYAIYGKATTVTATNTNQIRIVPASTAAATGSITIYRAMAFNAAVPPASVLAASEATTADNFTVALLDSTPQEATYLYEGVVLDLTNQGTDRWLFNVGDGSTNALSAYLTTGANRVQILFNNGSATKTGYWAVTPALGDFIQIRIHQASDGAITAGLSINGGSEDTTLDGAIATQALPAAWNQNQVRFSGRTSALTNAANSGLISFKAQSGAEKTLAKMQALTSADIAYYNPYDSQWTDVYGVAYPATATLWGDDVGGQAISAEQFAAGEREDIIHLLDSDRVLRYASLEINDTANSDGYVEAGRLVVAPAYQTTVNMDAGATFGYETSSTREETDGGATFHNDRPRRRITNIAFDGTVDADEALVQMLEIDRRLGTAGQFLWVFDPSDTYHMHRRSYLATLKELSLLDMPYTAFNSKRYSIVEEL